MRLDAQGAVIKSNDVTLTYGYNSSGLQTSIGRAEVTVGRDVSTSSSTVDDFLTADHADDTDGVFKSAPLVSRLSQIKLSVLSV